MLTLGGKEGGGGAHLRLRVILALVLAPNHRPPLVGVDQVTPVVAQHTGGARVHQRLDARLLARLHHRRRPVDIDLLEQGVGDAVVGLRGGRCGVDDNVGLGFREDGLELFDVGNVGLKVGHAVRIRPPVARATEVDDGHGTLIVAQQQADNVVAQETTTTNDHDGAELPLLF